MPDQTALLHEIIDHPDDDLPRLILADWLEDRNAPGDQVCGQFIRVQCELAKMGIGDPRRPELEALEQALAPRHPRRWAKPIRRFVRSWTYDRGLIGEVNLSQEALIARAKDLFDSAPVQRLALHYEAGMTNALASLPQVRSLRGLVLSPGLQAPDSHAVEQELNHLLLSPVLANLREVVLTFPPGNRQALPDASWLPNIQKLDFRHNHVDWRFPAQVFHGQSLSQLRVLRTRLGRHQPPSGPSFELPSLQQLEAVCYFGPDSVANALVGLATPNLEEFVLTAEVFGRDLPPAALTAVLDRLAGYPLRSLGLTGWRLNRSAVATLLAHPIATNLTRLRLGYLQSDGLGALLTTKKMPLLRTLQMDGITDNAYLVDWDVVAESLAEQLEILKLPRMGVREHTLIRMHASPLRDRLRLLDLSGNQMGDAAGQALAEFADWPRLVCLKLRNTGLSTAVLRELRQVLGERLHY